MKANLKVILSVVGVAALLASHAMAKQVRPQTLVAFPSDARASVAPYGLNEGGPYTPSLSTSRYGTSRDFQGGGGDK
jgi:hypothetical protein